MIRQTLAARALDGKVRALSLFHRRPFNLRHVVVLNGLLAATIPLYGHASPIRFGDRTKVGLIFLPADFVADF
jgi:hypothetical protein